MRKTDRRRFGDGRVAEEDAFDLERSDQMARRLDDVVTTADEVEPTVGVETD